MTVERWYCTAHQDNPCSKAKPVQAKEFQHNKASQSRLQPVKTKACAGHAVPREWACSLRIIWWNASACCLSLMLRLELMPAQTLGAARAMHTAFKALLCYATTATMCILAVIGGAADQAGCTRLFIAACTQSDCIASKCKARSSEDLGMTCLFHQSWS